METETRIAKGNNPQCKQAIVFPVQSTFRFNTSFLELFTRAYGTYTHKIMNFIAVVMSLEL